MIYIYALIDPRDGLIKYAGKTNNPAARRRAHRSEHYRSRKCCWALKLARLGMEPEWLTLSELPDNADWQSAEKLWIKTLRAMGCQLLNESEGGDGRDGYTVSDITKEKLRKANTGRQHTDATRKRMSESHKGQTIPEEQRQKISQTLTGRKKTAEHARKVAEANRGHPSHITVGRRLGKANKGRCASPETRAKMAAAQRRRRDREALAEAS